MTGEGFLAGDGFFAGGFFPGEALAGDGLFGDMVRRVMDRVEEVWVRNDNVSCKQYLEKFENLKMVDC